MSAEHRAPGQAPRGFGMAQGDGVPAPAAADNPGRRRSLVTGGLAALALVLVELITRFGALAVMLGRLRLFRVREALDQEQVAGHSGPLRPPLHRRAERARLGRRAQPRLQVVDRRDVERRPDRRDVESEHPRW